MVVVVELGGFVGFLRLEVGVSMTPLPAHEIFCLLLGFFVYSWVCD